MTNIEGNHERRRGGCEVDEIVTLPYNINCYKNKSAALLKKSNSKNDKNDVIDHR